MGPDPVAEAARRVRADLRRVGIALPAVPVSAVPGFAGSQDGRCVNLTTMSAGTGPRLALTSRIEVRAGLDPVRLGHVLAHEHTHALLHLNGGPPRESAFEEGVCELVAVVWLTNAAVPADLLRAVWHNPDPVYGGEMRQLVRVARRVAVGTVLTAVLRDGCLPEPREVPPTSVPATTRRAR